MRDGAQGIAFALNADAVQQLLSRRLSAGQVARVSHGIVCLEAVAAEDGPARQQAVVEDVADKSPAAAAGLRKGDVLVRVAGRPVANRFDVERALWDARPGDAVQVAVSRDGEELTLTVQLVPASGEGKKAES
jgi:serine protease Do/serine protease DegQ